MANFCTSCGSPLDSDQKFCTNCGTAVPELVDKADQGTDPFNKVQSTSDHSNDATVQMPTAAPTQPLGANPGNTSPMPAVTDSTVRQYKQQRPEAPVYSDQPQPASTQGGASNDKSKTILICVVVGLVVVLGILIGVLIGGSVAGNNANSASSQQQSQQATDSSSSGSTSQNSSSSSSSSSSNVSAAEVEIYNSLSGYYASLGNFDSAISDAAKSFNNNYAKKSKSTRSNCASTANDIQVAVNQEYNNLKNLSVSSSSSNYAAYQAMLTCYNDCVHRITAICDSWKNSLAFDDPTGHEDLICEPLTRDKVGDNNKYYTEFNNTYPSAKPKDPRG